METFSNISYSEKVNLLEFYQNFLIFLSIENLITKIRLFHVEKTIASDQNPALEHRKTTFKKNKKTSISN